MQKKVMTEETGMRNKREEGETTYFDVKKKSKHNRTNWL